MPKSYEIVDLNKNVDSNYLFINGICPNISCPNGICPNGVCGPDMICSCMGICSCPPDNNCAPNPDHNCGMWSLTEEY